MTVAAGALALAAAAGRVWWAERAYETALGDATARPAEDLPGRLDAAEEAMRRDPGEPVYALRVGQIRLSRAGRTPGPLRAALVLSAEETLRAAARADPFDPRTRIALSQVHEGKGEHDAALADADAAVVLGPRQPFALAAAARVYVRSWARTKDPERLLRALRTGHAAQVPASAPETDAAAPHVAIATTALRQALPAAKAGTDDILVAAAGDADLLAYAAEWLVTDESGRTRLREAAAASRSGPGIR